MEKHPRLYLFTITTVSVLFQIEAPTRCLDLKDSRKENIRRFFGIREGQEFHPRQLFPALECTYFRKNLNVKKWKPWLADLISILPYPLLISKLALLNTGRWHKLCTGNVTELHRKKCITPQGTKHRWVRCEAEHLDIKYICTTKAVSVHCDCYISLVISGFDLNIGSYSNITEEYWCLLPSAGKNTSPCAGGDIGVPGSDNKWRPVSEDCLAMIWETVRVLICGEPPKKTGFSCPWASLDTQTNYMDKCSDDTITSYLCCEWALKLSEGQQLLQ